MNNLQQFLEEEFKDYGVRMSEDEDHFEFESPSPSKILDFTNKVLDEVKREVEKQMKGNEESRILYKDVLASQSYINGYGNACEDISTIIDQLKLK